MANKTLRVCLSSDLPGLLDRRPDYLYFVYDKLLLYAGQNLVYENFVITSEIPESQVVGMLYILNTDGSVHRKVDYTDVKVAEIEDESQIDLLKKAGTLFYVESDRRYYDSQKRTLTLPYNNGLYELAVSTKNDAVYDNNTILKFNEKSNRFELYSDLDEDFIDFSKPFRGKETDTIIVHVDGPRITAKVKVSKALGNMLKLSSDGLYVKPEGTVDRETFDNWVNEISDFKRYAQDILDKLDAEIIDVEALVTPEALKKEIETELKAKYVDLDYAVENYQRIADSLSEIEAKVMGYATSNIAAARSTISDKVNRYGEWVDLDQSAASYKHEVDYYRIAEEYYYPRIKAWVRKVVIATALQKMYEEKEVYRRKRAAIATAIDKFRTDKRKEEEEKQRREKAAIATAIDIYRTELESERRRNKAIIASVINLYRPERVEEWKRIKISIGTAVGLYKEERDIERPKERAAIATAISKYKNEIENV